MTVSQGFQQKPATGEFCRLLPNHHSIKFGTTTQMTLQLMLTCNYHLHQSFHISIQEWPFMSVYQYIVYYKMRKSEEKKHFLEQMHGQTQCYIVHKTLRWLHNLRRICIVRNLEVVLWKVLSLIVFLQGEGYTSIVQFYQIGSFH